MSRDNETPFPNKSIDPENDRRQYLRVEDTAIVEVSPTSNIIPLGEDQSSSFSEQLLALEMAANDEGRLFYLMRELQAIDQQTSNAARIVSDESPELGQVLDAINQKLNCIGEALSDNLFSEDAELQTIDLSVAGIGFNYSEKLEDSSTHRVKIWFDQTRIGICATVKVLGCNRAISGGYHISARFTSIAETDRQLIAKHIMQIEASIRREAATLKAVLDNEE